jgi:subtilisin family serine protease
MKRFLTFLFAILWIASYSQKLAVKNDRRIFKLPVKTKATDYLPNTIIVKYKVAVPQVPNIGLKSATIVSIVKKFPTPTNIKLSEKTPNLSSKVIITTVPNETVDLSNIYEITYSGSAAIEDVINEILQDDKVEYAEPHYVSRINYTPNDPLYNNSGQSYLSQVKAPQAWDVTRNSSSVVIAIVDNGSDLTHPDLAANIYLNNADPINGIDDDNDGYIDNYSGWDLGGANGLQPDNDPNVKSLAGTHGVHVSGLASAVSDNGIGVSSIGFNAKLLIVKAAPDNDPSTISFGYEGIKYAADHGAHIINCSWGSNVGGSFGQDIINYALSKNCLVIAAAGNSAIPELEYPAAYPGVMAVANVKNNDVISESSSFGTNVSISAPGTNVLSTYYNNTYNTLTGTSMSAPVVASAAALVKARFPLLTMQQIGERLRATADNIDDKNPAYVGRLGKGRLNVFNALTQSTPSVRHQNLTYNTLNTPSQGDTISVYFDLENFLDPAIGLNVSITSANPFIQILSPAINIGNIGTFQKLNMVGPFKFYVFPSAPDNSLATFRINYSSNSNTYNDSESFTIPVALDYFNVQVNAVNTTMTSNGRVGYSKPDAINGLGFLYKNQNLLYEASLMIGNSPLAVSNNARNGGSSDEHFVKRVKAQKINSTIANFEGLAEFDDTANPKSLSLYIKHKQIAYSNTPDDKYIIAEYEVFNKGLTDLRNLFIGMFTDWDVDVNGRDVTGYDSFNKIAYVHGKSTNTKYAGIKLLTNTAPPIYYPLSVTGPDNPLSNGFTIANKYETLSSGIKTLSLGDKSTNGYDVSFVSGNGPFIIPANGSVKVTFAFLAADDLNDLERSAEAAQRKYKVLMPDNTPYAGLILKQNYPNPVQNNTLIEFSVPHQGVATLDIYNSVGKKVQTLLNENLKEGSHSVNMNASNLNSGVYIYRLSFSNTAKALKMIVVK